MNHHIHTYSEKSLHLALKSWYAQPGDQLEVTVDGYVIDLVRSSLLIEIQTRNFTALRRKLSKLLVSHPVRLVHPVPERRWIIKLDEHREISRRKSPKRGAFVHIFSELVYLHAFMSHPNFSLEVLLVHDEEVRCNDGKGSWRRKGWSICDRRLIAVVDRRLYRTPEDLLTLLPDGLPQYFTTADLAAGLQQPLRIAQRTVYCLKHMGMLQVIGKQGNSFVYSVLPS